MTLCEDIKQSILQRRARNSGSPTNPNQTRGLPEYASEFLESLISEYQSLELDRQNLPEAARLIETTLQKSRLDWGDLFIIERAILRLQPAEKIRRRAWLLRDQYRMVIGEDAYSSYVNSSPPDPAKATTDAEVKSLRMDLDQILSVFHWTYRFTPIREGTRNCISRLITFWMLIALALVIAGMSYDAWHHSRSNVSSFLMILYMGALGGFVSLQHRIQKVPSSGDAIINILTLQNGKVSVLLSPFSGAVFAFVLFLAFTGGVLQGTFFPSIPDTNATGTQGRPAGPTAAVSSAEEPVDRSPGAAFQDFLWHAIPRKPTEFAKLLLWCFFAGFAERLLPDTLDRLITRKVTVLTSEQPNSFGRVAPVDHGANGYLASGTTVTQANGSPTAASSIVNGSRSRDRVKSDA